MSETVSRRQSFFEVIYTIILHLFASPDIMVCMASKKMWFGKIGWVHYPSSFPGLAIALGLLLFALNIIFAINLYAHSGSDFLYGIFPFLVPTFLLYEWIASHTSK